MYVRDDFRLDEALERKKKVLYQLSAFGRGVSNSFFLHLRQNTKSSNSLSLHWGLVNVQPVTSFIGHLGHVLFGDGH